MSNTQNQHSEPLASGSVATDSGSTGGGAYSEPLADATYFGDGHAFTVAGDPEQLDKMAAYISELKCERAGLIEQLEALRPYVQHRSTCILNISQSVLREASWCDCGLTALLASNPATKARVFDFSGADDVLCRCGGYAEGDHNFDRTICMCGAMHYYCNRCGGQGDPCVESSPANRPEVSERGNATGAPPQGQLSEVVATGTRRPRPANPRSETSDPASEPS